MTREQLDELEQLERVAEPGEWVYSHNSHTGDICAVGADSLSRMIVDFVPIGIDGRFIAAARNAMPELIRLARKGLEAEGK